MQNSNPAVVRRAAPDKWTVLTMMSEVFQGLICNFLLFGPTIDNVMDWDSDTAIGMSYNSSGIAGCLSAAITLGTVYSSYLLNLKFQIQQEKKNAVIIGQASPPGTAIYLPLNRKQELGLLLNYVGNAAEVAGPANYLISAVTSGNLSRWAEVGVNLSFTAVGFIGSWGKRRTARETILESNKVYVQSPRIADLDAAVPDLERSLLSPS